MKSSHSSRSTTVSPETRTWYGNDALLSLSSDVRGTVARITAVGTGKVITVKTVDRVPDLRYRADDLIPLSGSPPAGAIVL